MTKFAECSSFDLAHPFAGDAEPIADFRQRHRMVIDAEAGSQNLFFAFLESTKLFDQCSALESCRGSFER
jgi:hypothetical protein